MYRKFSLLLGGILLSTFFSYAQTTTVSATVVDSDGTTWANGNWKITFVPNSSQPSIGIYRIGGSPLSPSVINQKGNMDGSGVISVSVYQNASVYPLGSQWSITVCPNASAACGTYTFIASGSTMNISTPLTAAIPAPRFPAVQSSFGYADVEAITQFTPGSTYWNVTNKVQRYWNGSTWTNGSSGCTVGGTANQIITSDGSFGCNPTPATADSNGNIIIPATSSIAGTLLTANSLATLTTQMAKLSSGTPGTIQITGTVTLSTNLSIPSYVAIETKIKDAFDLGNYNLTNSGPFLNITKGVFTQDGTGRVFFGSNSVKAAIPDWWITTSPNAYDNINSAITAVAGATGSTLAPAGVELQSGEIYLSNPIFISGVALTARVNSQAYVKGAFYTAGGNLYIVSTAGTTAGSAPSFNTGQDTITIDGTAQVMYVSTIPSTLPILPNVPAFIDGHNSTIQAAPGSSGSSLLTEITAETNISSTYTLCVSAGSPEPWCTGYGTYSAANCTGSATPYNWCTGSGTGIAFVPEGTPSPIIENFNLDAAGLTTYALFEMGSAGDATKIFGTNALGCGGYFDSASGAGMYYNTFKDLEFVGNLGCGLYETGQSLGILTNNANTFIHLQIRKNLGNGIEINAAQNDHFGTEDENNNGVAVHVRGVYTNLLFSGGWFEANHDGVAQGGPSNGTPDISIIAAGEPTNQGNAPVGITGFQVRGLRLGEVLPWLTWTPSTAYVAGEYVIPPANSSCSSSNNLCFQLWAPSTSYSAGDVVLSKNQFSGNGRYYVAVGSCTSGSPSPPDFSLVEGQTTTEGSGTPCVWTTHSISFTPYTTGGTSYTAPPTWQYTANSTFLDNGWYWQAKANNILMSVGDQIWAASGSAGPAPSMGPGGDMILQSLQDLSPLVLVNGSTTTTQSASDNSTLVASTAMVQGAIAAESPGSIVATTSQTAQSANYTCTTFYTTAATAIYRATCYIVITQAATSSSTMPNCVINFTDADTSTVETAVTLTGSSTANTVGMNSTKSATLYPQQSIFRALTSTPVKLCAVSYASSGATPMLYNVYMKLESLGP